MKPLVGQNTPVLSNPHHESKSNLHLLGPLGHGKHQVFTSAENGRFEATPGVEHIVGFGISNSHTQIDNAILQTTPSRSHRTHFNKRRRSQSPNSLSIIVSSLTLFCQYVASQNLRFPAPLNNSFSIHHRGVNSNVLPLSTLFLQKPPPSTIDLLICYSLFIKKVFSIRYKIPDTKLLF